MECKKAAEVTSTAAGQVTQQDLDKIWAWNTNCAEPIERCVHELFEVKARDHPNVLAICSWDGEILYGELDELATRLAIWLKDFGVESGLIVPLLFVKSLWTTIATLGVLKAGGGFVLLDPSLPETRLREIVRQVNADLILSSASHTVVSSRLARNVMAIDRKSLINLNVQANRHLPPVSPSFIMCLNFTSGSTGTPKGVMLSHRNYASALHHQAAYLGFTAESRIYDFSSYSFDAPISHTFTALTTGACLCVPLEQDRKNCLAESITSLRANVVALTPSVARLLDPQDTPTLRSLLFIGEPLSLEDVARWWGKVRVVNIYGPSECTPYSVINSHASSPQRVTRIGIGAGVVTWIVDPDNHDHLLPIGQTGELLLDGPLVGEGYLNDPEKTATAFILPPIWLQQEVPSNPERQKRHLYKTGDLVHYNEDGSLTFVGRKDSQVKIHGQRAELEEIEHCLEEHMPDAKRVVADLIMLDGESSSSILAGFLQMSKGPTEVGMIHVPAHVQDTLCQHLPGFMVPTIFFSMRKIPMTVTGKLDRRALREIGTTCFQASIKKQRQVADPKPQSDVGLQLQQILGRALGIDPVTMGLEDNFFKLGGDSIAAMRIVSQAQKAGIELTVSDIFRYPKLGGMISRCHPLVDKGTERIAPFSLLGDSFNENSYLQKIAAHYRLSPAAIEDAYPCTPLQEGLLSLSIHHPGEYMIQRILELRPTIETRHFCRAWNDMAQDMAILRTRIVHHSNAGFLQLVMREQIQWGQGIGLESYLDEDRKRPMDLGKPLARYALVTDTSSLCRWFVWTMHHSVYDGWSLPLMIDVVNQTYHNIPTRLPKRDFKAFIKYIGQQDSEEAGSYWRNIFANCDCTPFPGLPSSVRHPVADSETMHQISWLDTRSGEVTTSTLVRAAWALLTGCMTNSDNVVFGITTSGRSAPLQGIDEIVGPTIATIPLYVKIERSQKVVDYLVSLQKQTTEMIPFEQFGLHRIAKTCPEARQACMFQTLLVIQSENITKSCDMLGNWIDNHEPEWVNTVALSMEVKIGMKTVTATFDSNVIKPWVVQTLLQGLECVMKQLDNAGHEQSIADIELITPESIEQIWKWNRTVPSPVKTYIDCVIERSMQTQPTARAIDSWDGQLKYGELDQLSTQTSDQLVKLGVGPHLLGPDILVPLCFEKSKWAVVAMLGVLKAGAGFVLLDPCLPESRLQSIVKKVGAKVVLSSQVNMEMSQRLSEMVVQIGPDLSQISNHVASCTPSPATLLQSPSRIMYAVFTSGSTGTPKGVLVSHESFCSAVEYQLEILGFSKESRVLDFASYAFDAAIHNTMATLVSGGCLCIPSEKDRKDNIGSVMTTLRPTIANLTPTVARLLDPGTVPDLKTLILLGEPVTARDIKQWQSHKARLINTYGPAECTPISTINSNASSVDEATRIGKGVGLITWIVNPEDHNQLLPPGCTGELLLEGPLVGNGYMRDPKKTAEAFIENPDWLLKGSSDQPGRHGCLYKTGDLVQYNEDGSLTFMGRKDSQVKIRGQRFELEEVEHHIRSCLSTKGSSVATEVVIPEGDGHLGPVLVGFIQVDENGMYTDKKPALMAKAYPMAADIQENLECQLPSYMIPTVFFSVSDLPLTVTGKTDRKRLREVGRELLLVWGKRESNTSAEPFESEFHTSRPITETEQPAHTLAQKIYSMCPSWVRGNIPCIQDESQHQALSDIILHSGLDSVNMMELSSFILRNFRVQVRMQYLMGKATTIRGLSQHLIEARGAQEDPVTQMLTCDDLIAEINRHDTRVLAVEQQLASQGNITRDGPLMTSNDKSFRVFLTGATGFVGTQILRRVLEDRRVSNVICLVCGDTDDKARHRTINKAVQALWWTDTHAEKLNVWQGNLALPNLGLNPTRWDSLSHGRAANLIIHSGATVHWTKSYQVLEAVNVNSTMELLLLTLDLSCMRLLYVTGGRAWKCSEELDVVKEISGLDGIPYSQTKFVAEAVIRREARRNLSVARRLGVVNPGWVIGTPTEGFSNPDDYIWRLVATCIRIGAYNATEADRWLSVSDISSTAATILDAALGQHVGFVVESTREGMTWRGFWTIIADLGYRLKAKHRVEWLALVRADLEIIKDTHPLWPLAHMVEGLLTDERVAGSSLAKRGTTPLRLEVAIKSCVQFLVSVGFLPKPPSPN